MTYMEDLIDCVDISQPLYYDEARLIAINVLATAIDDLHLPLKHPDNSSGWFISNVISPYSFLWLCQHLSLSPVKIRTRYAHLIYGEFLTSTMEVSNGSKTPVYFATAGA